MRIRRRAAARQRRIHSPTSQRLETQATEGPRFPDTVSAAREAFMPVAAAVVIALGFGTARAAAAAEGVNIAEPAQGQVKLDITAQPINDALNEFGRQSGLQVFFLASDQTSQVISTAISGTFEPKAGLARLLSNTGLSYKELDQRSVAIVDPAADSSPKNLRQKSSVAPAVSSPETVDSTIRSGIPATAGQERTVSADSRALEEVIVTAQRREQGVQDVANSLQVITGDQIDRLGQVEFEDYISTISGVGFSKSGEGSNRIGLRGISSFTENRYGVTDSVPTVGLYLDEIPLAGAGSLPDLALFDLARIEVLKGPQGTLYGEGAMGGAIRMITKAPELNAFSGKTEATLSSTEHGGLNYQARGMVNLPLAQDRVAMRIVGSYRDDSGFIDNVTTGEKDLNRLRQWSVRALVHAQVTDNFTVDLFHLHDDQRLDGLNRQTLGLDDFKTDLHENEYSDNTVDISALTLRYDFGFAALSSVSSYFKTERNFSSRFPIGLDGFLPFLGLPAVGSVSESLGFEDRPESFTQEVRLVSQGEQRVDWVAGAFYRDRDRHICAPADVPAAEDANVLLNAAGLGTLAFPATTTACDIPPPSGLDVLERRTRETFEQIALYAESNIALTDRWELTVGARWFDEEVGVADQILYFGPLAAFSPPQLSSTVSSSDVLFKGGLSWAASDNHLIYVNASQGFRSGAPNLNSGFLGGQFPQYESDSLWNYELGTKSTWLDGRLVTNAAVYFLDWSDIQAARFIFSPILNRPVTVFANAGSAKIRGLDLQLTARPTAALELGASVNLQDSEFTKVEADTRITQGSSVPNAPELTAYAYAQYSRPMAQGSVFVRVDHRFVDEQTQLPVSDLFDPRLLPSYSVSNVYAGYRADRWYLTAFVNNVADERAYLGLDALAGGTTIPDTAALIQPRTIGMTVGFNF
jgi:iron complex outermembrane recepter protein